MSLVMCKDNEGICCFKIEDVVFMWLCVYCFIFTSVLRAIAVFSQDSARHMLLVLSIIAN